MTQNYWMNWQFHCWVYTPKKVGTQIFIYPCPHPASGWKGHRFQIYFKINWHCMTFKLLYFQVLSYIFTLGASLLAQTVKTACNAGDSGLIPELGRSLEKGMQPIPVFLLGKIHGLGGTKWATVHGVTESDTTEWLTLTLLFTIPNMFSEFKFDSILQTYSIVSESSWSCFTNPLP